jgi:putative peptidoglycan lipid II flippase
MLKQILTLSGGSAIGKLIGVVREILFASFFGTSSVADAYRAALSATLAPVYLFTSEALNAAFIPQFSKDRKERNAAAWSLFNGIGLILLLISIVIAGMLYFFAQNWIEIILPGFTGSQFTISVQMLQIMAWGIPLYVLSALLISLEIGSNFFRMASMRPFVQNIGIILAMIVAFIGNQPIWIAWWFTGTYFCFSLFGVSMMITNGILKPGWHRHWDQLRPVMKRFWIAMKPMVFFSLLLQANLLLEKAIASLIGQGAIASIEYARLIPETAYVLLIVPLGLVSLSVMVNFNDSEVRERSDNMSSMVLLLFVPLSGLVLVSSQEIIRLIYQRGAFDEASVLQTSYALQGMSVGLWAFCLAYLLHRIYNARLRNYDVLRITTKGLIVNALFIIIAYKYLGVLAIGLGSSLGRIIMAILFIKGIGEMHIFQQIAKICLYSIVPYILIALTLKISIHLSPILNLTFQTLWCVFYWGLIFYAFPTSREILNQLLNKFTSFKIKQ